MWVFLVLVIDHLVVAVIGMLKELRLNNNGNCCIREETSDLSCLKKLFWILLFTNQIEYISKDCIMSQT